MPHVLSDSIAGRADALRCASKCPWTDGGRRRPFATGDQSRNLAWLAPLAFGETWPFAEASHNNHHAFPTSARHGLGRWQVDPGRSLINVLERCHLAWGVIRISPARQQAKRGTAGIVIRRP